MDPQALSELFATTYNADPNIRKRAELQIRSLSKEPGMIAAVMQIIGVDGVDTSVRQACAVWLKNRVDRSYYINLEYPKPDQIPIEPVDRTALKQGLFQLVISAPSRAIRVQVADCIKLIAIRDFGTEWPDYLDHAVALLSSKDPREVYAGLIVILEPVKAFRYRSDPQNMVAIMQPILPLLLQIGQHLLENPSTPEAAEYLHLIFKIYRNSILNELLPTHSATDSILLWGKLLLGMAALQVPNVEPEEDERERSEAWKAKKWAFASLNILFTRYGNPTQMPTPLLERHAGFAKTFVETFAPEILKVYVQQVELYVTQEAWLSRKVIYKIVQFLTECVKPKSTWALLKPQFQNLVSQFIFPQLCFSEYKKELWRDDPVDYLRVTIDEYEDYQSPASAASSFLLTMATGRTKTTFVPILSLAQNVLTGGDGTTPEQKFGALSIIVSLASMIMRHPDVKANVDQFMLTNVVPLVTSEFGFLRAAACEAVATLEHWFVPWQQPESLALCYNAIVSSLDDPETPVRVHAALALSEMIRHNYVQDAVKAIIGKILQTFLELSETTDLEILTTTLETWVDNYRDEILPVALQLTQRLAGSYMKNVHDIVGNENTENQNTEADDEADNKMYAAAALLKTVGSIVTAMDGSLEILGQIQQVLIPIIQITLNHCIIDLLDGTFDLIDSLIFNLKSVDPGMWPIFEQTYKIFKVNAVDFLEEMLPSLDNFMSYGKEVFYARADYCEIVLDIYESTMANTQNGENDCVTACKLIESLLLNLRGHVDQALPRIVATSLKFLDPPPKTRSLTLSNLDVLINCILYNPPMTFHLIESSGAGLSLVLFDKWFKALSEPGGLPRVHDMKLSVMAMCALLELDEASIPETLKEGWTSIVGGALTVFKMLPDAVNERKKKQEELVASDEDLDLPEEDELDELHLEEEEDDVWDEDSALREVLAQRTERAKRAEQGVAEGEEDEEEDEDIEEELGYISPLDTVDPYLAFKRALTILQMKNPGVYQASTGNLSVELQSQLIDVMKLAEQKEAEVGPIQI